MITISGERFRYNEKSHWKEEETAVKYRLIKKGTKWKRNEKRFKFFLSKSGEGSLSGYAEISLGKHLFSHD